MTAAGRNVSPNLGPSAQVEKAVDPLTLGKLPLVETDYHIHTWSSSGYVIWLQTCCEKRTVYLVEQVSYAHMCKYFPCTS